MQLLIFRLQFYEAVD